MARKDQGRRDGDGAFKRRALCRSAKDGILGDEAADMALGHPKVFGELVDGEEVRK